MEVVDRITRSFVRNVVQKASNTPLLIIHDIADCDWECPVAVQWK
jgi:hypothetical protein